MMVVILFRESVTIDAGLKRINCGSRPVGFVGINCSMFIFFWGKNCI